VSAIHGLCKRYEGRGSATSPSSVVNRSRLNRSADGTPYVFSLTTTQIASTAE
jgi:hypothetical protein